MGDRVLAIITASGVYDSKIAIYGHWSGMQIMQYAQRLRARMHGDNRDGDVSYSLARLCGLMHEMIDGATSLGIIDGPTDNLPETLRNYSHGDAGLIVIDCVTWKAVGYGGYWGENGEFEYNLSDPIGTLKPKE